MDTKRYVEYLDKEMTIMGILSAVSLAAPAGILNALLGEQNDVKKAFWDVGQFFIIGGSVFCVVASLLFYKQRSILAWYYGQICLHEALEHDTTRVVKLRKWLEDADSWATWWPYSWGFTALSAGLVEYLFALFFVLVPQHWRWLSVESHTVKWFAFCICPILTVGIGALQWYVLNRFKFSDTPWKEFFKWR